MNVFRQVNGTTLIELMAALAIVAILCLTAASIAPSFIQKQRANAVISKLSHLLHFARTEAITSASIVTICPLDSSKSCSGDWNTDPITVFRDPDNSRSLTQNDTVVKQIEGEAVGTLKSTPSYRGYFQFDALGSAKGTAGNLTYSPNAADTQFAQKVIVNFAGRVRLAAVKN